MHAGRQAGGQTGRQAGRHAGMEACRQADQQGSMQDSSENCNHSAHFARIATASKWNPQEILRRNMVKANPMKIFEKKESGC